MSLGIYPRTDASSESFKWPHSLGATFTLFGYVYQVITSRWQETVMLTGVGYAVIHATAALFQRQFYKAASFLVLGAITGVGAFYMRQISILQKMEETQEKASQQLTQLTKENSTLKQTNQTLNQTHLALNQTKEELTINVTHLERGNKVLENTTSDLTSQVSALTTTKTSLEEQVLGLKEQNANSAQQIAVLTHTATCIRSEVALFQSTNTLASDRTLEFEKKLTQLLGKMSASIELSEKFSSNLSEQQSKQNAELETIFSRFKQYLREEAFMHRFEELGNVQIQLEASTSKLALTEGLLKERIIELRDIDGSLERQRKALEEQIFSITEQGVIYRDNNKILSSTARELATLSTTLEKALMPVKPIPEELSPKKLSKTSVFENNKNPLGSISITV